jgi:hypothetical protein
MDHEKYVILIDKSRRCISVKFLKSISPSNSRYSDVEDKCKFKARVEFTISYVSKTHKTLPNN